MGGFFGVVSKHDAIEDVFFGTDYHSHLGTRRAGISAYDEEIGLQREIHNIQNSPFRTKFEHTFDEMKGKSAIGCISDFDPQPLLIRSNLGKYAICVIGVINNADALIKQYLSFSGGHFGAMTGGAVNSTELVAALINQQTDFTDGIKFAQSEIDGTASILILKEGGNIIAARDKLGRLPIVVGKREDGYSVSFESFAHQKLGFEDEKELGPGEIVEISVDGIEQLNKPGKKMRICSFLWSYYGFPTSTYEGVNVEMMRYKNGQILANADKENEVVEDVDYVGGVPDSGTPHAIGYANESTKPFARAFINDLITDKNLLFVDDSIVRGTQLKETVDFLYDSGAKSVHMRSACPPIMYNCKYLNFSRSNNEMELITRRVIVELEGEEGLKHLEEYSDSNTERGKNLRKAIADKMGFASLEFQTLKGIEEAIGIEPCKLCTYCWSGKE